LEKLRGMVQRQADAASVPLSKKRQDNSLPPLAKGRGKRRPKEQRTRDHGLLMKAACHRGFGPCWDRKNKGKVDVFSEKIACMTLLGLNRGFWKKRQQVTSMGAEMDGENNPLSKRSH